LCELSCFVNRKLNLVLWLLILESASCCDCYYNFLGVPSFATIFCLKCFYFHICIHWGMR
jgi:hypothetical protein